CLSFGGRAALCRPPAVREHQLDDGSLGHHAELLEERERVEVLARLAYRFTAEAEEQCGPRRLPLAGGGGIPPGAGHRSLPGHLQHDLVAARKRTRHRSRSVRHRLLPALEQVKDLLAPFGAPTGAELVVD